jgi:hypothetical protein
MWIIRIILLFALTGCLDEWEKNPATEKGIPLGKRVQEKNYPAPSPASFDLRLLKSNDGVQDEILTIVQAMEGERIQITAKAEVYDSNVAVRDIILLNPDQLPGAQVVFDRGRRELVMDWQIPERFVQSVDENYYISAPVTIRLQAHYTSVTPEGDIHNEAREIEKSFQYLVYRNFYGLEPSVLRIDPAYLEMVENEVLRFDIIIDDPASSQMYFGYDPDIRVVPIVPETNTAISDGAHFVRRDKTKPVTLLDPNQPTVWRIPMLMDLRGKEVTYDTNMFKYGIQVISRVSLTNDVTCTSTGGCEYKSIASRIFEGQTRVYTKLQNPRTSMTFSPVLMAGQWNYIQWQIFDPEGVAEVTAEDVTCPNSADCGCSRIGRELYTQCFLSWEPPCGINQNVSVSMYAKSKSRTGPSRESGRIRFVRELRISKENCTTQGANP